MRLCLDAKKARLYPDSARKGTIRMRPKDRTIDVRGLKIHYAEWGDRQGEPFILLHGFLDHSRSWDPFVAAMVKISKRPMWIIAPDCRGHGDSGWVGAGGYYHFPDYVLDLDTLILNLGSPFVTLMGHSMGGTISFLYAGTFPNRVRQLILVEGLGPSGLTFATAPLKMRKWLSDIKAMGQKKNSRHLTPELAAKRLRRRNPRLKAQMALHLARHGIKQQSNGNWVWKFDPLHRTTSPQPFYLEQALKFLSRIKCPALLVRGKESSQSPQRDRKERLQILPHRTVAEIPRAGHMVHHDNPEGLARVVADFLNRGNEQKAIDLHKESC
jgi:pimeloyl-ACP methyl ester carboxylesterase